MPKLAGTTVVLAAVAVASAAAAPHTSTATASRRLAVVAPRMERTPPYVLGYCRRSNKLPSACPKLLPRMSQPSPHWETSVCLAGTSGCLGLTWDVVDLVDAGNGARPPIWSHITIYAGKLTTAFPFAYPTHGVHPRRLGGLFAKTRAKALYLGSYRRGNKLGTVVLAPSYPGGGEQADHLIFRWKHDSIDFAIGRHGWEPRVARLPMEQRWSTATRYAARWG